MTGFKVGMIVWYDWAGMTVWDDWAGMTVWDDCASFPFTIFGLDLVPPISTRSNRSPPFPNSGKKF